MTGRCFTRQACCFFSALLLLCGSLPTLAATPAEAIPSVPMSAIKVGEHSYYVQGQAGIPSAANMGFMSNAGFVVTKDGVVVVDALGTPALARKLALVIRKITAQPIRRVLVTHYHADHIYGLQVFKALGAEIWAQRAGADYLKSDEAKARLAQRREALSPWVDEHTHLVGADLWLDGDTSFKLGDVKFTLYHVGPAHTQEDMAIMVENDGVLYSGDTVFRGRIPFIGNADSRAWLANMNKLLTLKPRVLVPGHGAASKDAAASMIFTRDYLAYLRKTMGRAAEDMMPFDEAYKKTDWSRYRKLPAFKDTNRANAYNTYLLMEREELKD